MTDQKPPVVPNAPGLSWRRIKTGWIGQWRARQDLVSKGYYPKNVRLWLHNDTDEPLCEEFIEHLSERCTRQQTEMLIWGRGGLDQTIAFDGSIKTLINAYQTDDDSPYRKTRYRTRIFYDALCRRIVKDCPDTKVADLKARIVLRLHEQWAQGEDGQKDQHIPRAHALIGMLRTLINFGAAYLEDEQCERLAVVMHRMKFEQGKARVECLTAEQATIIRNAARADGRPSLALAQAIQFDLMLRQKDVIGEWVPLNEKGPATAVIDGNRKWIRGLRWDEIDQNWIVRHVTSKRQKEITVNLRLAPMVMEELGSDDRSKFPASGPVIVADKTGLPWSSTEFARIWRTLATKAGIPKSVRNMDSRAGAITEATEAGAPLESIKHAATHSDISMTQRYARGGTEKTADVMTLRVAHRNKQGTPEQ